MKHAIRGKSFSRFYKKWGSCFFLLGVIYFIGIFGWTDGHTCMGWWSIGFGFVFLILLFLFLYQLRLKVAAIIQTIDKMLDDAMSGYNHPILYEETTMSSLEYKLFRYVEKVKAIEKRQQTDQQKTKALISDISHQTKTPLANIIIYTQLLEERLEVDDSLLPFVNQIQQQSEKLDWLIHSLVKMSRLETGIIQLQTTVQLVLPVIQQTMKQIAPKAEAKNIQLTVCCEPTICAKFDAKWTSEAFFNLIENAVKYSEPNHAIRIKVVKGELFIRIDIVDEGIGIEEEEINLIFQRFYRSAKVAQQEGVGIGLYLARELIMQQGGYIKVTSTLQRGSMFSIFLPAPS